MNAKKTRNGRPLGRAAFIGALCAAMAAPAMGQMDAGDEPVQVTDYGTVTLAVQDTDLAQVLEMLSIQSQKNIITSKNVSATISANLYDVTFHQALDAILKVNGYNYVEEGNFIYIYTQAELDEIITSQLSTESRMFELNYLSAADANDLIAPLLSEVGKSSALGDVQPGIQPDIADAGQDDWAYTAMLVVNDYPENLQAIASLLSELDAPPHQVLIESTILQTTLDEQNAWGVDFSIIADVDFLDFSNPLSGVTNLLNGDDPTSGFQPDDNKAFAGTSTAGNTRGPGTFKLGLISNDVSFFLKVLDEVTDSTVLARPKVMCLNRQRAEVLVGARVGYLSTTATETSTTQTVEFLDTGIQLLFRPFISRDGMIRLELAPSVSEASLRTVTDAQGLSVTIPDELTNEITTNVRVQDGQTIVLGGLYRESTRITRRQVPLLGDIPIAGALFKGQDDFVDRDEIIFLITPSIVHDEMAWKAGEEGLNEVNEARVGAREGLLPWSRDKNTAMYNNRAFEAYNRGDLDQALYYINNSLRSQPNQPEIVRLRDRVLGSKEELRERSILERSMRAQLGYTARTGTMDDAVKVVLYDTTFKARETVSVNADDDSSAWTGSTETASTWTADEERWSTDVQTPVDSTPALQPLDESVVSDERWLPETETPADDVWTPSGELTDDSEVFVPETETPDAFTPSGFDADSGAFVPEIDAPESFSPQSDFFEDEPQSAAPAPANPNSTWKEVVEAHSAKREAPLSTTSTRRMEMQPLERVEATPAAIETEGRWLPELKGTPTASAAGSVQESSPRDFDEAETEQFVDLFIHEYFSALGLRNLSPFADASGAEMDEVPSPFATFDDMLETDLAEAENEEQP